MKSDANRCLASALLEQIKISCYTEYKAFGPSLIYNTIVLHISPAQTEEEEINLNDEPEVKAEAAEAKLESRTEVQSSTYFKSKSEANTVFITWCYAISLWMSALCWIPIIIINNIMI